MTRATPIPRIVPEAPLDERLAVSPRGQEVKRSSWYAGMSFDPGAPPPGSPAAWNHDDSQFPALAPPGPLGAGGPDDLANRGSPVPFGRPGSPQLGSIPRRRPASMGGAGGSGSTSKPFLEPAYPGLGPGTVGAGSGGNLLVPEAAIEEDEGDAGERGRENGGGSGGSDRAERGRDGSRSGRTGSGERSPARSPVRNPFNFESTFVSASPARPSQRRGHRYKHSSVSMNFFQEPEARAPLAIPQSLAVPTARECWQSVSRPQALRLAWCGVRFLSALLVYLSPVAAAPALAHMLGYDALAGTTVACVEVLANFDAWATPSLKLPFALARVEVLVSFGLAIMLVFVGGDMLSHTIQEVAEHFYGGQSHHAHAHHSEYTAGAVAAIFGSVVVVVASLKINGALSKTVWTTHQFSCVTAAMALAVLATPVLGGTVGGAVDAMLTPAIAAIMIYFGWQTSKLFGGMLVMSYGGPDRSAQIVSAVAADPSVSAVTDMALWQVHHELWLASMRISMHGGAVDERRVRQLATRAVGDAMKDVVCETTIDIQRS